MSRLTHTRDIDPAWLWRGPVLAFLAGVVLTLCALAGAFPAGCP